MEKLGVPRAGMYVEEHGAGSVADIGDVNASTGELPKQPAIHRAEGETACIRQAPGIGHVRENPRNLGCGEIGVNQQTGARLDQLLVTCGFETLAHVRGAPVLPNDSVTNGPSSFAIPHDGCFALVRDADRGYLLRAHLSRAQSLQRYSDLRRCNLLRIVLNPSRLRKDLVELPLRYRTDRAFAIKQDGPRTGCALIKRQDVGQYASVIPL